MHLSLRPVPMSLRPLAAALLCAWAGLAFAADPLGDPNPTHLFVLEEGQAVVGTLQRVSARYSDYYGAAQVSDDELGKTAFRNITGLSTVGTAHRIRSCAERAVLVANPLKDFLEDIQLED